MTRFYGKTPHHRRHFYGILLGILLLPCALAFAQLHTHDRLVLDDGTEIRGTLISERPNQKVMFQREGFRVGFYAWEHISTLEVCYNQPDYWWAVRRNDGGLLRGVVVDRTDSVLVLKSTRRYEYHIYLADILQMRLEPVRLEDERKLARRAASRKKWRLEGG